LIYQASVTGRYSRAYMDGWLHAPPDKSMTGTLNADNTEKIQNKMDFLPTTPNH